MNNANIYIYSFRLGMVVEPLRDDMIAYKSIFKVTIVFFEKRSKQRKFKSKVISNKFQDISYLVSRN